MSTGLGDKKHFSHIVPGVKPNRCRILYSGTKPKNGCCLEVSMILPRVEKFGLIIYG